MLQQSASACYKGHFVCILNTTYWGKPFSPIGCMLGKMVIIVRQPPNQPPVTTLTGEVRDQAALLGVLNALYDMGCPLLRVERLDPLAT